MEMNLVKIHKLTKKKFFFVCIINGKYYKRNMGKNGVEVIIFNGKKWLNEKHIEKKRVILF